VRFVPRDRLVERLARCVVGLACFGLGISMMIEARLGTGPWDVLHTGLGDRLDLPTGVVIELLGVLILLAWIPLRIRPGIGTILNAVEIGLVVDLIGSRLPDTDVLALRVAYVFGAVAVIAIGSGLYIGAGLGSGPRDGLMVGLNRRFGWSIRLSRTIIEGTALVSGWLLGGTVGVGTAIFLVAIGPAVQVCMPRLRLTEADTAPIVGTGRESVA
jgi:uncharacterized membrane protein YczE